MVASQVYVRALALGCFYSHISTRTFRRALTASLDSCAEIKSARSFSGVTSSGRGWRKVPERDALSVRQSKRVCEDTETVRQRERETDRQTETERGTDRGKRERQRHRERQTDTDREE